MSWHGVGDMNRVGGGGGLHAQNMHFRHSSIFTPSHNTQYSEGGGGEGAIEDFEKF